ncbi:hypothetical protein AX774_g4336 [Zancudomyces culisetae]|uniref:Uncharacterized protein n=1 Tax=Zancudomyces culisetae TaxID=1213189 RepID=A0A1R1PMK0_ZANCU|nr:hypothetical protein AX774_g4336 [Zancudomyces culisetae]|eukprot:OMH82190.1 hypothetical protein AX774_g4336 [Zancudomyces culisetae]
MMGAKKTNAAQEEKGERGLSDYFEQLRSVISNIAQSNGDSRGLTLHLLWKSQGRHPIWPKHAICDPGRTGRGPIHRTRKHPGNRSDQSDNT